MKVIINAQQGGNPVKVIINTIHGGFGLSAAAYEKLIEYGVPVRAYVKQERDPVTHRYLHQPANDGLVIFDRRLQDKPDMVGSVYTRIHDIPYWDEWTSDASGRYNHLLVRVVEELGSEAASGPYATLKVIEVPDDAEWDIQEYDGAEWIAEKHRTWGE